MKWHGVDLGSKIRSNANLLKSASLSNGVITFTRGDDTTQEIEVGGTASTYRVVIQSNYFDNTSGSPRRFMPFNSLSEQGYAGSYLTVVPAFSSGRIIGAAIWTQGNAGSSVFGFHKNSSSTPSDTATATCTAGNVTQFTLTGGRNGDAHEFAQGDELGFSLDPTSFPYGVSAQIIIEYDI